MVAASLVQVREAAVVGVFVLVGGYLNAPIAWGQTPCTSTLDCVQKAVIAAAQDEAAVSQFQGTIAALTARVAALDSKLQVHSEEKQEANASGDETAWFPFVVGHAWAEIIDNKQHLVAYVQINKWGGTDQIVGWHYEIAGLQKPGDSVRFRLWGVPY